MKIGREIEVSWSLAGLKSISDDERAMLNDEGFSRAGEMMDDGFTSGELNSCIVRDGFEHTVRGWWSVSDM